MQNPVLVEVRRGEIVESIHRGVVCVVNEQGEIIFSVGDVHQLCYPRSAMKLLQHIPLVESGALEKYDISLQELAIMCGSHNGEKMHVEVVQSILRKIGIDEMKLQCGAHYPNQEADCKALYSKDQAPTDLHNNCSGKHAGFLVLCKFLNADMDSYLLPNHPVQQLIKTCCAEMYEVDESAMQTAIDGCSAPVYAVDVLHQAIGYKNLAAAEKFGIKRKLACDKIIEAVKTFPEMLAGTERYCTDMIKVCGDEIVGKTGAEGVFCMSLYKQKMGVCIKIDDGKMQPQYNVAQAFIEASGLFEIEKLQSLRTYLRPDIKNWKHITTGHLQVSEGLFDALKMK